MFGVLGLCWVEVCRRRVVRERCWGGEGGGWVVGVLLWVWGGVCGACRSGGVGGVGCGGKGDWWLVWGVSEGEGCRWE